MPAKRQKVEPHRSEREGLGKISQSNYPPKTNRDKANLVQLLKMHPNVTEPGGLKECAPE